MLNDRSSFLLRDHIEYLISFLIKENPMDRKIIQLVIAIVTLYFYGGCARENKPQFNTQATTCEAYECHGSTVLGQMTPVSGKHQQHLGKGYSCELCHNDYMSNPLHRNMILDVNSGATIVQFNQQNPAAYWDDERTSCNNMTCHGAASWYGAGGCTICHGPGSPYDPLATNGSGTFGKHKRHVTDKGIDCLQCHNEYKNAVTHANGSLDTADPSVVLTLFDETNSGGTWTNDTGARTGSCGNMSCHTGADWYGTTSSCLLCHGPGSSYNPLVINGSGTGGKHVKHVTDLGYACEKCHIGYRDAASHGNGTLDTANSAVLMTIFDTTNSTGSWNGDTGAFTGSCVSMSCHNVSLDWYSTNTWAMPACGTCHAAALNGLRQVMGAGGDFGANAGAVSHHVSDVIDPLSDPSANQCRVCHNLSQHMGGIVRLRNADSGSIITYDSSTPSSLEVFCLSCHDSGANGGAMITTLSGSADNPFNDSRALGSPPFPYSKRIAGSWAKSYGHGPNGNHTSDKKLTCMGSGLPGTGCHGNNGAINAHGSGNQVLATRPYNYSKSTGDYTESWFTLCFNCHGNYPGFTKEDTLGVKQSGILDADYGFIGGGNGTSPGYNPPYYTAGITSYFADHDSVTDPDSLNDKARWGPADANRHWFHLGLPSNHRGTGADVYIGCVNCHDVHGSSTPYGAVYDEMGYTHTTTVNGNSYGKMNNSMYTSSDLEQYPFYCSYNCHPILGTTRAWFTPINE